MPLDIVENVEVGSGTGSTIRSAKNSSASVDMAEDAEVGDNNSDDDKTVKKSPSKKLSGFMEYFTSLHARKRWVSLNSFGYGWSS